MLTTFILVSVTLGGTPGQGPVPMPPPVVRAVGIGYPPTRMTRTQASLMAQRAAQVAALRNLAVNLRINAQGHLPPFRYISTKHLPNGSIEVTVETTVPIKRARNTATLK